MSARTRPWREAESLRVLIATINARAPKRDKASDGMIGDARHQAGWEASDHNPWVIDRDGIGVVRARDVDDDPRGGCDGTVLAQSLAGLLGKHPAMGSGAMVIHNRRIITTDRLREGWRPYPGENPHETHVHVSVGRAGYDSRTPWPIKLTADAKPSRVAQVRVMLRAIAADKRVHPRRRRRVREALDVLPTA